MKIIKEIKELREITTAWKLKGENIAFVPTMGALHQGHLSLVKTARMRTPNVICSVFVNPTQFNDPSDLKKYPRTLEADAALLESVGTTILFAPEDPKAIYNATFQSWVSNEQLSSKFEGADRPGHFRGVTTVVNILFNLVQPNFAVFGEKDCQQLRIIEKMVEDLHLPIEIVRGILIREPDGLAMSSRNVRLSVEGRKKALAISRGLSIARDAFSGGNREAAFLRSLVVEAVNCESGVNLNYVAVVSEDNLEEIKEVSLPARILVAATVEGVRLIDNMALAPANNVCTR